MSIEETTEKDFDKIYGINVKGVFFLVQAALPRLRDGGRIINVSTGLTRPGIANPEYANYASSKGAVNVLTTLLAKALAPRRITVNALAPGVTDTDMNAGWLRDAQGLSVLYWPGFAPAIFLLIARSAAPAAPRHSGSPSRAGYRFGRAHQHTPGDPWERG